MNVEDEFDLYFASWQFPDYSEKEQAVARSELSQAFRVFHKDCSWHYAGGDSLQWMMKWELGDDPSIMGDEPPGLLQVAPADFLVVAKWIKDSSDLRDFVYTKGLIAELRAVADAIEVTANAAASKLNGLDP